MISPKIPNSSFNISQHSIGTKNKIFHNLFSFQQETDSFSNSFTFHNPELRSVALTVRIAALGTRQEESSDVTNMRSALFSSVVEDS